MSADSQGYSPIHRGMEVTAIFVFGVYAFLLGERALELMTTAELGWVFAGAAFTGYLLADMISGFVHWFADTYAYEDTPLLGPNFVKPFRMHHVDPTDIANHGFIETNGNNCIVSFWVLMWAYHGRDVTPGDPADVFVLGLALFTMLGVFGTNQFHKWAHSPSVPKWVALLQRTRLILSPDHHEIHHTWPHHTYFCITTGWMNWILAKLRVFRSLEWALRIFLRLRITAPDRLEANALTESESRASAAS